MVYILYCEFDNTKDNHTGMAYFFERLAVDHKDVRLIKNINQNFSGSKYIGFFYAVFLFVFLRVVLKKNDKVLFGEYLTKDIAFQDVTAKLLRFTGCNHIFTGLVHLAPSHLLELYKKKEAIKKRLKYLDNTVTFGSSLHNFIKDVDPTIKVKRTVHYVENNFYRYDIKSDRCFEPIQVLVMGAIKRDFAKLVNVLRASPPSVFFHICLGKSYQELKHFFESFENVKIYGYLEEDRLKGLMQMCLVNMSILLDTVGSNAITTSLAMGQIQIVSDVGSIRDYCDEDFAIFCKEDNDFINAIIYLNGLPKEELIHMSITAHNKSRAMWIDTISAKFKEIFFNE